MSTRQLPSFAAIACNAALLFGIQPIIAKTLLPRFGGSAGVWVASMMFFQIVLLLGYLYSFWITRYAGPRARTAIHLALLAVSLLMLPVRPSATWTSASPLTAILWTLAASVGLPFFLLSTTGPLVQSWYGASPKARLPYRLFAVSNTACLLALLAYPLLIEPALATRAQLNWWSAGYLVVVLLLATIAIQNRAWTFLDKPDKLQPGDTPVDVPASRPILWILLSACASALWLAVANYLSQEVAAIPFLWVVPLTLYLLSFILSNAYATKQ